MMVRDTSTPVYSNNEIRMMRGLMFKIAVIDEKCTCDVPHKYEILRRLNKSFVAIRRY